MNFFDLKISTINRVLVQLIDDDKLRLKLFSTIHELNKLLEDCDRKSIAIRKAVIREMLEDRLQTDRELRLIVLRLRTEARKEFLNAMKREQDSLWIYYLLMIKADLLTPKYKKSF